MANGTEAGEHGPTWTTVGIGLGAPTGVSGRLWVMHVFGNESQSEYGALAPALELQAGSGGCKLAVGYGIGGYFTGTIRVALVRTWSHPLLSDRDRTYAGPELELGSLIHPVTVIGGVLFRLGGGEGRRTVASIQLVLHTRPRSFR